MGTPLGPKYIPYTYMEPLGSIPIWDGGTDLAPLLILLRYYPRPESLKSP